MNPILKALLTSLAAKAIPEIERLAIEAYLKDRTGFRDKGRMAVQYAMTQYKVMSARIPALALTTLDDMALEMALNAVVDEVFRTLDKRITQAARDVREAMEGPGAA